MTEIFVFGSNLLGRHGKGAALEALKNWGAVYGQAVGRQGNSYAIPTKNKFFEPIKLKYIHSSVLVFLRYAEQNPDLTFRVTAIGCGLSRYRPYQIGPMFDDAPPNVILPREFRRFAKNKT